MKLLNILNLLLENSDRDPNTEHAQEFLKIVRNSHPDLVNKIRSKIINKGLLVAKQDYANVLDQDKSDKESQIKAKQQAKQHTSDKNLRLLTKEYLDPLEQQYNRLTSKVLGCERDLVSWYNTLPSFIRVDLNNWSDDHDYIDFDFSLAGNQGYVKYYNLSKSFINKSFFKAFKKPYDDKNTNDKSAFVVKFNSYVLVKIKLNSANVHFKIRMLDDTTKYAVSNYVYVSSPIYQTINRQISTIEISYDTFNNDFLNFVDETVLQLRKAYASNKTKSLGFLKRNKNN